MVYFWAMNKIYCLSTCSTCTRILKDIHAEKKGFALQDIKTERITPAQLDELKKKTGSYEALFSRRAIRYKEMGLKDKSLTEKDYRALILEEYTFLKRPVVIRGEEIFVGSEKGTVERLKKAVR
jgi:arsenate reductase